MEVTFYGAVREVTGSMHLLANGTDRILMDSGLFQGRRKEAAEKNRVLPIDPRIISNLVLSHAHIDHSGRIPLLVKNGYGGRIHCTRATRDACAHLLPDSAHIQESDADYVNYKRLRHTLSNMGKKGSKQSKRSLKEIKKLLKKGRHRLNREAITDLMKKYHLERVFPLYSITDAETALEQFEGYPYQHPFAVGQGITCTLYDGGHILGSAISVIRCTQNGRQQTICYTGDLGRFDKPILEDPTLTFLDPDRDIDLLIMESTYGNRHHGPVKDLAADLTQIITNTYDRGGVVLIPSFAYGRTQELIYVLHELYNQQKIPKMPVYVDSPLATRITQVFGEHPEVYDAEAHKTFLEKGKNPFAFPQLKFTASVEDSMALMRTDTPHIVIASSGMCEAGRILHHLRYKIHHPKNTILIVGFMAQNTLGRRIRDLGLAAAEPGSKKDTPDVKILGKEYPLKAQVHRLDGFSAHGDQGEMLRFLKRSNLRIKKIALVHGEEEQTVSFSKVLQKEGYTVEVPRVGETIRL